MGAAIGAKWVARIPIVIAGTAGLLASLVATRVGVFFGFYPANKAARPKPIDALRYR